MYFCTDDIKYKCTAPKVDKGKTPSGEDSVILEFTILSEVNNLTDIFDKVYYFYDEISGRVLSYLEYKHTNNIKIIHNADASCTVIMQRSVKNDCKI